MAKKLPDSIKKLLALNESVPPEDNAQFHIPNYSGVQTAALKTSAPLSSTAPGGITNSIQFSDGTTFSGATTLVYSGANVGVGDWNPLSLLVVSGANPQLAVFSGAQQVFAVSGSQTYISGGTAAAPGLAFSPDRGAGISYTTTGDTLTIGTAGVSRLTVGANTYQINANNAGTVANPTLVFNGDIDTGFYQTSPNSVGVSAAGTRILLISGGSAGGLFGSGALGIRDSTAPTLNGTVSSGAMFISGGELWYIGYAGTQTRVAVS